MRFWKYYAEGNSYVVVDDPGAAAALAGGVNDPARGLGGDGLLLAQWGSDRVGMRIVNPDGSAAPACGNGARCLAALAIALGRADPDAVLDVVSPGLTVRHRLLDRATWRFAQELTLATAPVEGTQFVLGTPHRVVLGPLAGLDPAVAGPPQERSWPGGTNVMFAEVRAAGRIAVLPWERGVGATLGCATGAAAAALAVARREPAWPARTVVEQPGGTIAVTWDRARPDALTLEGTARPIATGEVHPW
ncbi:hypothetical protein [Dactylosporangium salmoneum]|uniref:diaminopimelate epimerase n=1 Tax=Dactylosporangium salmoneum TaxID=53361 RepID=A0ABP5SYI3_9ACTN